MSSAFDDDERPEVPAEFRAQADRLIESTEKLDDTLRQLGLYVDHSQLVQIDTPMGPRPALAVQCTVGKVAYSDRVQHPENYGVDQQFRVMEREITANDHEEIVAKMRRNLAAGRDPMDDGDDDEQ